MSDANLLVRIVLAVLATYRLVQFITVDDGPFMVFSRIRTLSERIGSHSQTPGDIYWCVDMLIHCPYCLGVWFGGATAALIVWPTLAGDFVLFALAIAGAQTMLQERKDRQA